MVQQPRKSTLYGDDFYSWTLQQAQLLRDRKFQDVDVDLIIEEIETLGRSEAASLRSSLRLIVMHLLKMKHQPDKMTNSWHGTIVRERDRLEQTLADNPGLKPRLPELFQQACTAARKEAVAETGLDPKLFSIDFEFTLDQVRDDAFLPSGRRGPDAPSTT